MQLITNPQTLPKLLGITHDGPVKVEKLGEGTPGNRLTWTVPPERFDSLIEMINENGGPDFWRITKL